MNFGQFKTWNIREPLNSRIFNIANIAAAGPLLLRHVAGKLCQVFLFPWKIEYSITLLTQNIEHKNIIIIVDNIFV